MTQEVVSKIDPVPRRRISGFVLVPLIAFALMVLFGWGLFRGGDDLPSALLDKPVPEFALAPVLRREEGLSTQDLIGHVSLVNVFASWCVPCRAEHPLFMELSATGEVPLYGINYKDPPEQARHRRTCWHRMGRLRRARNLCHHVRRHHCLPPCRPHHASDSGGNPFADRP